MELIWRSQKLSILFLAAFLLVFVYAREGKKQQDKYAAVDMNHWDPMGHAEKRGTQPQSVMVPVQSKSEGASLTVNVFGQPKFFVFMGKKNRLPPIPQQHRFISHPPIYEDDGDSQSPEPAYDEKEFRKIKGFL